MGHELLRLIEHFGARHPALLVLLIAASAYVEHVFPPWPGDLAVTLGVAVGLARELPLAFLYAVAVAGSVAGAMTTYAFGRWLARTTDRPRHPWVQRVHDGAMRATEALEKHGVALVAISRFVPVGRAFVLVAAGFHKLPPGQVALAAGLGAGLWNAMLCGLAWGVGHNMERLAGWLDRYNRYALIVAGAVVAALAARALYYRARAKRTGDVEVTTRKS
ncbi:MAG: VTT domain-containing protein [Polyangiales bacterium]